jgi:hypothetical protein
MSGTIKLETFLAHMRLRQNYIITKLCIDAIETRLDERL